MQNTQIYSDIINSISTRQDFLKLENDLDLLSTAIFETKGETFDEVLKNKISIDIANSINQACKKEKPDKVISDIKNELKKVKFMEITVAINPTQKIIDQILNWIKSKNENIAIDIKTDKSIIAGAAFSYEGKFFDSSARKIIDQIIKQYV